LLVLRGSTRNGRRVRVTAKELSDVGWPLLAAEESLADRGAAIAVNLEVAEEGNVPGSLDFTIVAVSPAEGELQGKVQSALQRAVADEGKITDDLLNLPGMSGRKYRRFINNLLEAIPDPRYLEVGSWQGSTLCSAIFGNSVSATAVDNWSQFGGPADKFRSNVAKFRGKSTVKFFEKDFRNVNFHHIGKFNVYLFDGPHEYQDHYDGITLPDPALDEAFVLIVNDWNWEKVRRGTRAAIHAKKYQIEYLAEIRTTRDNSIPEVRGPNSDWHNGYFIGAFRKPL
jgi:hypothetical protein